MEKSKSEETQSSAWKNEVHAGWSGFERRFKMRYRDTRVDAMEDAFVSLVRPIPLVSVRHAGDPTVTSNGKSNPQLAQKTRHVGIDSTESSDSSD